MPYPIDSLPRVVTWRTSVRRFLARSTVLLLLVASPAAAGAQGAPDDDAGSDTPVSPAPDADAGIPSAEGLQAAPEDVPPPNLAALERERSRECVAPLESLASVASRLDPLRQRTERLGALHRAVSAEDSVRVTPLERNDPVERAVAEWFEADRELALRYLDTQDEAVREERSEQRRAILDRLQEALLDVNRQVDEIVQSAEGLERALQDCQGRILVRSAVLDACAGSGGPVCESARDTASATLRFVGEAVDLWNLEQLRPWTDPTRIRVTPQGSLGGARTASLARRGNMSLVVSLETAIQPRDSISVEGAAEWDAHLDSLGFTFDHPRAVMAPAIGIELDVPGRLGEETGYILHFGAQPAADVDVLWSGPLPEEWPIRVSFIPGESALVRLARGDPLVFSAVVPEEGDETPRVVWSMGLTPIAQSSAVTDLLRYMGGGRLSADLASILPAEDGEEATDGEF